MIDIKHAFFKKVDQVATLEPSVEHPRDIQVDSDKFSQLDKKLCKVYMKISKYWNSTYLRFLFNKQSKEIPEAINFFKSNAISTGSTVEYSAIYRTLVSETIVVELDQLYCLGPIDEDSALKVFASVQDHPGFFRVMLSTWKHIFPFFKEELTYLCLCSLSNDAKQNFKTFSEMFNEQNVYSNEQFLPTAE